MKSLGAQSISTEQMPQSRPLELAQAQDPAANTQTPCMVAQAQRYPSEFKQNPNIARFAKQSSLKIRGCCSIIANCKLLVGPTYKVLNR
jgi:hypothetical protein